MSPDTLVSRKPFKMEEQGLMALLECPLCLEPLDSSAKVLPCQHTFCVPCLQRQEAARSPLLCPECRAPVPAKTVEELPANLLLVRLLEGLHGSAGPARSTHAARYAVREDQQQQGDQQGHGEAALRASLFNHRGDASGDQALAPREAAASKHRVDHGFQRAESFDGGGASVTPAVGHAQPNPPALCRALCDFNPDETNMEDSQYCLGFIKGDILTVIRRVDENWIEAKLGEKVGLCPQQFTEPNSVAAKLLRGKSWRGSDSAAEFHHQTGNGGKEKATDASNRTAHYRAPQVSTKTAVANASALSNQRKQPAANGSNLYQAATGETSNIKTLNGSNHRGHSVHPSALSAARAHAHPSRENSQRPRRSSDSSRHGAQGTKRMSGETPPSISMALVNPQAPSTSADGKNSSTQQLSISVCAVLYSYKPRRPEELELRKGEMVGVYGKFKEGWLRGLSLRTGKVGILPSNFVTPVLRTSARLTETKAAPTQHNAVAGKKPTAVKSPAVVLALDKVNVDGAMHPAGQAPPVPNGVQHAVPSAGAGKPSFHGGSQGWETVRRIFNPHRASNHYPPMSNFNVPSNSQHFAQVQASGYSPALQRKKPGSILSKAGRPLGWMTESAAPSTVKILKDRDFSVLHEEAFQPDKQPASGPHSILVRPDAHKSSTDKPAKSVRFLTDEDSPPPRHRTFSWSGGNHVSSNTRNGPPPLEVWAPSLTMGRDGPGIILRDGKGPILRKGIEADLSDLTSALPRPASSQPSLSAISAQFSPSRHRVTATHLAQTDSELSLLQGELVLVHRPRPDGRVLVTQESSGQTGLFHSSVLQALERLS